MSAARKKNSGSGVRKKGKDSRRRAAASDPPSETETAAGRRRSREFRPFIYAGFDFAMAVFYIVVLFRIIPNRHGWVAFLSWLTVLAPVVMGTAMIYRRRWSWWMGVAGCGLLLVAAVSFLAFALISAAFLSGVYGSFGQAASTFTLIGAALVIEFVALLPTFQLKFLMTRAGRRSFGKEPIWP